MTVKDGMASPRKLARMTGVLYFLVFLTGVASEILVGSNLFVPRDTAATVNNIVAHESIFRLGFVISLSHFAVLVLLVLALYKLLRQVDKDWALVMAAFGLVSVSIGMVSLLFQYAAPLLLVGNGYSTAFTADQLLAQVQFFIDMQVHGDKAAQILSVWLLPLGYLIFKSGFLPRILGVLIAIAGLGYMTDFLIFYLFPNLGWQVAGFAFLFELPFSVWLLIKGVKTT
jgi:hypothetical protein